MKKIIISSVVTSSLLMAAAYKVPEQSINSTALGGAYVANTDGADTAYYNPANMAFMPENRYVEMGFTWAHLPRNVFEGEQALSPAMVVPASNKSLIENLQLPYLHYVGKSYGRYRWGMSMTVPGGLTKRWNDGFQKASAEEFTLKIVELNPSISYKVNDKFAIGGGLRLIYSEGVVKSDGTKVGIPLKREMEGDTFELGYNLAMSYRPTSDIKLAATYRSNVNIKEDGDANLYLYGVGNQYGADVTVPLPAALNLSISKTWQDKYTLELNYERTYWSKYKNLDFEYATPIQPTLVQYFDDPKPKRWKDTNTFRVGFSAKVTDKVTLMAGYARDFTPISKKYISYELPDSDANIFSLGAKVQINENLSCGIAYLHDDKESRTIKAGDNKNGIIGKFSGGGADLVSVGLSYKF